MREKPPPTPPWGRDLEGICIDSKQTKVVSGINFLLKKSFIEINVFIFADKCILMEPEMKN